MAVADASFGVAVAEFFEPENEYLERMSGNAVEAPLKTIVAEPGSDDSKQADRGNKIVIHEVQPGDTISQIAAQYNVSTNSVLWANNLSSSTGLKVGDAIRVPPTTGVIHEVKSGDTLLAIANKYDASIGEIVKQNGLRDNEATLSIGQTLIIPDGVLPSVTAPRIYSGSSQIARDADPSAPKPANATYTGSGWVRPVPRWHQSQGYSRWHLALDLSDRTPNTPIYASQSGTVTFVGWLGGYGNYIIVKHDNGWETSYAHLSKFHVSKGQKVGAGETIGIMGSTGRSTGPHLHFTVKAPGGKVVNPNTLPYV